MRQILFSIFFLPALLSANLFPHFNPETVGTFEGVITSVQTYGFVTKPTRHTQILVRAQRTEIVVDLGPDWFIEQQDFNLYPGATVKVVGSLVMLNGTHYVIASSITIDNTTHKLREKNGLPVWRRW
ncbi:MAG: hypothetical protein JJU12_08365 [Chlamydiales bacterium]|nr:hypothetical protein [Chlamydiales bacterium]